VGACGSRRGDPRTDRRGGRDRLGLRGQQHDEQQHQQHDLDSVDHDDDVGAAHDDHHVGPSVDQHDDEHGLDDHDLHQHHVDLHQGQWRRWGYLPVAP
jgi:hypothetical protein